MKPAKELSNLECVVIAQVRRVAPCTAHEIRVSFANSTSNKYSSSAGSIYPLLRRLTAQGYVGKKQSMKGNQRRSLYTCTSEGKRELKRWLFRLSSPESFPDDPVRTRMQYLDVLSPADQGKWLDAMSDVTGELETLVREEYRDLDHEDMINSAILANTLDVLKGRQLWLDAARDTLRETGKLTIGQQAIKGAKSYRPISGKS